MQYCIIQFKINAYNILKYTLKWKNTWIFFFEVREVKVKEEGTKK